MLLLGLGLAPAEAARPGPASPDAAKPNIVFIMMDDLGWRDFSSYGSTFYETPHIDLLASQGILFTNAYSAGSVCSPSRGGILTGKYPACTKTTDYFGGTRKGVMNPATYVSHLVLEEKTLAEALKQGGYRTGFIGKWHLGGAGFYPESQGFDVNIGGNEWGHPNNGYFSPYGHPKIPDGPPGEYLTDRLTDESLKFIEANRAAPFLLYLAHYAPHTPLQAKPALVEKYKAKAAKLNPGLPRFGKEGSLNVRILQDHAVYAAMIQSIDESVGRIMAKLEQAGLADNTVVIVTSDNGGLSTSKGTPTSNVPLRAGKGWLYEGGLRIPLLVRWPGTVPAGRTSDVPVMGLDFYPTFLEMAGLPLDSAQHMDAKSFLPLLKGAAGYEPGPLFWHYPHYSNQGGRPGGAVRLGDYKLIQNFEDDRVELYNLKTDTGEARNLAAAQPAKAAELRKLLEDWRLRVKANMPTWPVSIQAPAARARSGSGDRRPRDGLGRWHDRYWLPRDYGTGYPSEASASFR